MFNHYISYYKNLVEPPIMVHDKLYYTTNQTYILNLTTSPKQIPSPPNPAKATIIY